MYKELVNEWRRVARENGFKSLVQPKEDKQVATKIDCKVWQKISTKKIN